MIDAELQVLVGKSGGRVMHTGDQHEVVSFRPENLEAFVNRLQLVTLHRYANLAADANAVGLTLSSNQLQFLLRQHRDSQVYASCANLSEVDEALRRRRQEQNAPGGQTRGLQGFVHNWVRTNKRDGA